MPTVAPQDLLAALRWRYATKKYDPTRQIPADVWAALEESLVLTPSSMGVQPWRFLVVDDAERRAQLVAASYGQRQPVEASRFVVFTVRRDLDEPFVDRHVARSAEVRGLSVDALASFKTMIMRSITGAKAKGTLDDWMTRQPYIALGQFMLAAAWLGVDTTPMEGLVPEKYDEILGLTGTGWSTVVACAAGYRATDDKYAATPKVRFPLEDVVQHV
jgi:nitroreductase